MTQDATLDAACSLSAFVCSQRGRDAVHDLEKQRPWRSTRLTEGGIAAAVRMVEGGNGPQVVIVELGRTDADVVANALHELARTGAKILMLGDQNDIRLYRRLTGAGAHDYIMLPATAGDLLAAIDRPAGAEMTRSAEKPRARVIAVCGCAGGAGASLLAENLASLASRMPPATPTALIDLDLKFGSVAADLDIDETRGLFDALLSPGRIDETFLNATMGRVAGGPAIYSARAPLNSDTSGYEAGIAPLIDRLRGHFGHLIADVPRDLLVRTPSLLALLDDILLVMPPGFSGLTSYTRLQDWITDCAPALNAVPVLSDLRRDAGLTRKELLAALKVPSLKNLPRSDEDIARSILKGTPVVAGQGRSPYARAVTELWTSVTTPARASRKRGGWSLFGGAT